MHTFGTYGGCRLYRRHGFYSRGRHRASHETVQVRCPQAVEWAIEMLETGYDRPLSAVRGPVAREVRSNAGISWNEFNIAALIAEHRLIDMFEWLSRSGYDVHFRSGCEGDGKFRLVPAGIGGRVYIMRYPPSGFPTRDRVVEYDLLLNVAGHPLVIEGRSGENSYRKRTDFDGKVDAYRRALGGVAGYVDPAVILGVPDNHELLAVPRKRRRLESAGGRVLRLGVTSDEIRSLSRVLSTELSHQ